MITQSVWGIYPKLLLDIENSSAAFEIVPLIDLDKVRENHVPWLVYCLEGVEDNYLCLRYRDFCFQVRPEGFEIIESPVHSFDDIVSIRRSTGKIDQAVIIGPAWHFKMKKHYYRVKVGGKIISSRIFEEDIMQKEED